MLLGEFARLEHPVLRLALLGFDLAVTRQITAWASRSVAGWPTWRVVSPEKADAWFINGAAITHSDPHGCLTFNTGWPTQPQITLDPSQVERPIALALPLPGNLEARETVGVSSEPEVRLALQRFEAWLRPLRTEFALGAHLLGTHGSLGSHVYHLKSKNTLIAVVDLIHMRVALSPTARPIDLEEAVWDKRPPSAADFPPAFLRQNVSQVMWTYAMRTERDVLPPRYRKQKIYSRLQCGVPARWLHDEHLLLMSEVKTAPASLDELASRTSMLPSDLSRYVASLYYAGAITTDERRAKRDGARTPVGTNSSLPPSLGAPTAPASVIGNEPSAATAPVRLFP